MHIRDLHIDSTESEAVRSVRDEVESLLNYLRMNIGKPVAHDNERIASK